MNRLAAWLRPSVVMPTVALALGLGLALGLARWGPHPDAVAISIPEWLASSLAGSDDPTVLLTRPGALWLMPVAVLPFLIVVSRRSLVDIAAAQIVAQLVARLAVLMAAALALAQPVLRSPIRGKTVVYVVDVSDSIDSGQLDRAAAAVAEGVAQLAREDLDGRDREDRTRLALVTYAGRASVREVDANADQSGWIARHDGDRFASNHAAGLRLAAALVDPQTEGRVILVSDGTGTLAEREDLEAAVRELEERGLTVHTRSYAPAATDDVLVDGLHLPAEMRVGETFEVAVDLVSTWSGPITVSFAKNGQPNLLQPSADLTLRAGPQQVKFQTRVTTPGPVVFTASLRTEAVAPATNRRAENDAAAVVGEVQGRPRVLIAGVGGDEHLANALRSDHLDVTVVRGASVPATFEDMREYDLVVFSDLPARAVPVSARQVLDRYVRDHSGGFIMIGGENSFGMGGWGGSVVDKLLPVRFEGERQREQPKLALVLVIDKSGSMSSEDKLDLVKEAARATARTLDPSDELGVIAFDSRPHVLVRLQPASNRIRIAADIRRLSSGGGTNALPALREAYLQLAGSNAMVKHVILLSDGQSPETGISALLGDMRDADITVSSVGVGAGAGKDLLQRIANRGRGRFYFSQDGTDVPRIFSRETKEVTRNAAVEISLFPRISKSVQALRGIDVAGAPGLKGIVPIQPKPLTETLLRTHTGDALLVRGRRELGRTAAFASDAKARWAARWVGWSGFAKLWSQVARDTMRQGASLLGGATIAVSATGDEGTYRVVVDVDSPQGFANDLLGEIEVLDPQLAEDDAERTRTVPLHLSAPGRYEATFDGVDAGQRLVTARLYDQAGDARRLAAEAVSQVSVPYPPELNLDQLQPRTDALAAMTTGTHEGDLGAVLTSAGDPGRSRQKPLWPYVLWALLLPLLVVDLLLRRVTISRRAVLS